MTDQTHTGTRETRARPPRRIHTTTAGTTRGRHGTDAHSVRRAPARAHLGPSRRAPGGHGGLPPARARPRCRGRAPGPAGGGRGGTVGRTRGRTETRTPTAPPPRRPGGAQRAGRGKGAAERTGSYRSGDGPETDVAARPALRAAPARATSLPVSGPSWHFVSFLLSRQVAER